MHLKDDQSFQSNSKHRREGSSDHLDDLVDVISHMLLKGDKIVITKGIFNTPRPVDLINSKNNLTRPLINPLIHLNLLIIGIRFLSFASECLDHDVFDLKHPDFDITFFVSFIDNNFAHQCNFFLFSRNNSVNSFIFVKANSLNAFETFVHVGLNSSWIFGLCKKHQKII